MSSKNKNADAFVNGVLLGFGLGIIAAAVNRNRYAHSVQMIDDSCFSLEADTRHLSSDWATIGVDFRVAMDKNPPTRYEQQQED
jgi:hypothetical protein